MLLVILSETKSADGVGNLRMLSNNEILKTQENIDF